MHAAQTEEQRSLGPPRGRARALLASLLMLAVSMPCVASRADPKVAAGPVLKGPTALHRNLRVQHQPLDPLGLDASVQSLLQDRDGFLWVGTSDGLFRIGARRARAFHSSRQDPASLRDPQVIDLALDAAGTLWIATVHGLHRYAADDEAIVRDPRTDRPELAGVRLTAMTIDDDGTFWLGTERNGLFALQETGLKHYQADSGLDLPKGAITDLHVAATDHLWVASDQGGLSRFDRRSEQFVRYHRGNSPLTSNHLTRLFETPRGVLWIGTAADGLYRFDPAQQHFEHFALHISDDSSTAEQASTEVRDVLVDRAGTLWVASADGLREWRNDSGFHRHQSQLGDPGSLSATAINRLYQDRDGVLWIGSEGGIDRFNFRSEVFTYPARSAESQPDIRVTAISECADGSRWLGTRNRGVARARPGDGSLAFLPMPAQKVRSLLCDRSGRLWIGTVDGGLLLHDTTKGTDEAPQAVLREAPAVSPSAADTAEDRPSEAPALQVIRLAEDPSGTVWAGTLAHGLFRLEGTIDSGLRVSQFSGPPSRPGNGPAGSRSAAQDSMERDHLPHATVRGLYADQQGTLWIGTGDGQLSEFNPSTERFRSYSLSAAHGESLSAAQGESSVAAHDGVLNTRSSGPIAVDLIEARNGDLWLATANDGLLRWASDLRARREPAFSPFNRAAGLPSDALRCLLEDEQGRLWLSSNNGLIRFDPGTLNVAHFNRRNSLLGDRFYFGAKAVSRNGQLLFGSAEGLLAFYPEQTVQSQQPLPLTVLGRGDQGHQARSFSGLAQAPLLTVAADSERLHFEFDALAFSAPEQQRFRFQLVGYDRDWQDSRGVSETRYTNLPPGRYEFRVQSAGPAGAWQSPGVRLAVEVPAPPLRSPIALAAYLALALGLIALLIMSWQRERKRLRHSRRNLEIQVEHRTAELEERNRQLQQLNLKLQEACITDPLTGLLNRRSFYEFVSREVARVERAYTDSHKDGEVEKRLLFFMMIDLDAFKQINDNFGHHTGDHTLVQVSDLLRACARDADTVFRWGGDEFLVVGQVSNEADLKLLAERFRRTLAEHRFDPKYGKALRLSASIGVAPYPFSAEHPGIAAWEQVADIADLAAYLAKTHGKNAWVCAQGGPELTANAVARVKDNFELLIETQKIIASSSRTMIPIPGATRQE